jgi:hypothetical protein
MVIEFKPFMSGGTQWKVQNSNGDYKVKGSGVGWHKAGASWATSGNLKGHLALNCRKKRNGKYRCSEYARKRMKGADVVKYELVEVERIPWEEFMGVEDED